MKYIFIMLLFAGCVRINPSDIKIAELECSDKKGLHSFNRTNLQGTYEIWCLNGAYVELNLNWYDPKLK